MSVSDPPTPEAPTPEAPTPEAPTPKAPPSANENPPASAGNSSNQRFWWLMSVLAALVFVGLTQREFIGRSLARYALARLREDPATTRESSVQRFLTAAEYLAPAIAETDLVRARIARRSGDFDSAEQFLIKAKYHGGSDPQVELERWLNTAQRGQTKAAEEQLPTLLEEYGDDAAEICRAFVLGYLRERRFGPALMMLDGWRDNSPGSAEPIAYQGRIQAELRNNEEAEKSFHEALKLTPNHGPAALGLAQLLNDSKRIDEAASFFEIAAKSNFSGTAAAYVGWARCERSQGNAQQAQNILAEAIANFPRNADLLIEKANLAIDQGNYQLAIETLEPEIARDSRRQDVNYVYAMALRGIEDVETAAKHFEYASLATEETMRANDLIAKIPERPADPELRFQIGSRHLKYGNSRDGLMWLESVLRLAPNHQPTHRALADYYAGRIVENPKFIALAQRHRMQAGPKPPTGQREPNENPTQRKNDLPTSDHKNSE